MSNWDGNDFDHDDSDPWTGDEGDDETEMMQEVVDEIYDYLDDIGAGEWQVTITLEDGTEHVLHVPIELVWEIRDFCIEYGLDFDYEYEGG